MTRGIDADSANLPEITFANRRSCDLRYKPQIGAAVEGESHIMSIRTTTFLALAAALAVGLAADALAGNTVNGHAPPKTVGMRQPLSGSSGPHRQPVDPNPSTGGDYSGDSAGGGSGGGGYFGDPNAPGHKQF